MCLWLISDLYLHTPLVLGEGIGTKGVKGTRVANGYLEVGICLIEGQNGGEIPDWKHSRDAENNDSLGLGWIEGKFLIGMIEFKDPNGNPEGLNIERILPFCFPEHPAKW